MSVVIVEYDPRWPKMFAEEKAELSKVFDGAALNIHHIGSTSVPGLAAKPIIDILIEVSSLMACDGCNGAMHDLGYEVMGAYGIEGRRYFRKINADSVRTHHVHAFEIGSLHVHRHLVFRDYLIAHPERARDYAARKRRVLARVGVEWNSYMDGKEAFVLETERLALEWREASSFSG